MLSAHMRWEPTLLQRDSVNGTNRDFLQETLLSEPQTSDPMFGSDAWGHLCVAEETK